MMQFHRTPVWITIATVMWLAAGASEARAFLSPLGCDCLTISRLVGETRRHLARAMTEAATMIVEGLREQTRQNSRYLDRQVMAHARIADGQEHNAAMRMRDRFRAQAESGQFDPNPEACLLVDASMTSHKAENNGAATGGAIASEARTWLVGDTPVARRGGVELAAWLNRERQNLREAGDSPDATTDWNLVNEKPTLDLEDERLRRALARLVSNTVNPVPARALTGRDLKTPAGLAESVRRQAATARNHAAISAIQGVLDMRSPRFRADAYRSIADGAHYESPIPPKISELQQLDIRSTAYFAPTPRVIAQRLQKSEEALLQDILDLLSVSTRIAYLRLEQENRNTMVLASILGIMTDTITSNPTPP